MTPMMIHGIWIYLAAGLLGAFAVVELLNMGRFREHLDEVTGKCIGTVSIDRAPSHRGYPTRTIQLFDSKYTSSFNTHAECVAFVKGVEAVPRV